MLTENLNMAGGEAGFLFLTGYLVEELLLQLGRVGFRTERFCGFVWDWRG